MKLIRRGENRRHHKYQRRDREVPGRCQRAAQRTPKQHGENSVLDEMAKLPQCEMNR